MELSFANNQILETIKNKDVQDAINKQKQEEDGVKKLLSEEIEKQLDADSI